MILVVGDLDRWAAGGRELPAGDQIRFVRPELIGPALIRELAPTLVLAPLQEDAADALEVASRLVEAGYAGPFRAVVAREIRHLDLIRQEVSEATPGLDFDVIVAGARLN